MVADTRISDHGAKIAASRLRITVAEYRRHEAADEHWCPRCCLWLPRGAFSACTKRLRGVHAYCKLHRVIAERQGRHDRKRGISYAGPAFSLTPEREATVSRADSAWSEPAASCAQPVVVPSGHSHARCPAVLGCREGRIPEGWVRR